MSKPELNKPELNKKNLIKFAKNLYSESAKKIEYMPLCEGTLASANGEILHCALGELCEEFIGAIARRATKKEIKIFEEEDHSNPEDGFLLFNWNKAGTKIDKTKAVIIFKNDDDIINNLKYIAKLNNKNRKEFSECLKLIPEINDIGDIDDEEVIQTEEDIYINRAKRIQEHLLEMANYLE